MPIKSVLLNGRYGLRMGGTQALPGQARDQPIKLLACERHRSSFVVWPDKAAALQTPRAQPHSRSVVDQYLQPVSASVGKDVRMVGLGAQSKTTHHLCQQCIDANT